MRASWRRYVPLALLPAVLLAGCGTEVPVEPRTEVWLPGGPAADQVAFVPPVCGQESFALLAGQTIPVGAVTVGNDEETLYVSFETADGWSMTETHLAVAASPDLLPNRGGQLAPGLFPESGLHDPAATTVHYAVPLSELEGDGPYLVAAQADVMKGDASEGAWADGTQFSEGGGWATYATYAPADCGGVTVVIGSDGGDVVFEGGTLTIPAGALESDVQITVTPVPDGETPASVLPGTAVQLEPDGQDFDVPVTLVRSYDGAGLSEEQEPFLAIHVLEPDGEVRALPSVVDPAANTVTALLDHFSTYAVAAPPGPVFVTGPDLTHPGATEVHSVEFVNVTDAPIPAGDLTLTLTVQGPVSPDASPPAECTTEHTPATETVVYTCTRDEIPAFGYWGVFVQHLVAEDSEGGLITAVGGYAYDAPGGETLTGETAAASTEIVDLPVVDLGVGIVPPDGPVVGIPFDFPVSVFNGGPEWTETASVLIEVRKIPGGVTLLGTTTDDPFVEDPGCVHETVVDPVFLQEIGFDLTCPVPFVGVNGSYTLTLSLLADSEGPVEVTATVSDSGSIDPFLDNNTETEEGFVSGGG